MILKTLKIDDDSIAIVIKPYGDNRFACGLHSNYDADTEDKIMCYTVAMGLCQIALDDPDLVYEIGHNTMHVEENKSTTNGKDKIIHFDDYKKKLH